MSIDADAVHEVVRAAQQGSRQAADRLVREHDAWVRSVIYAVTGRSDDVDDIAQQVWTRVWERLGSLENPRQLRSWLYTVARNTALDVSMSNRRRTRRAAPLDEQMPLVDRSGTCPVTAASRSELQHMILEAVRSLPALYREPFVLRHLNDWSYAQIAEVLGLSVESVETRLVRARALLREMLAGKVQR